MGLSPLNICIREIWPFAPIFQGNNCFRIKYLKITFTFNIYLGTSWKEAKSAKKSIEILTGWWKVVFQIFGTSWMLCGSVVWVNENIWEIFPPWRGQLSKSYFEVFSRAGSDWPLCKISTLTATPFMFFVHKYLIFDKYLTEIFSLNLWSVFQLSQTASDGFDWNWVKSGPLLFVIFQILNAMDRPIVQCLLVRCEE